MDASAGPRAAYEARERALAGERGGLLASGRRLHFLRTGAFVAALLLWAAADVTAAGNAARAAAAAALALFAFFVRRHRAQRESLARVEAGLEWVRQGRVRLDRRWSELPSPDNAPPDLEGHAYAVDLDLFGVASLDALLGLCHTPAARAVRDSWLLEPTPGAATRERQEAVRELASDAGQREASAVEGMLLSRRGRSAGTQRGVGIGDGRFEEFLRWCREEASVPGGLVLLAWVLPGVTAALIVGDVMGLAPTLAWVTTLFVQGAIAYGWAAPLHRRFSRASAGVPAVRAYAPLFHRWEVYGARAPLLARQVGRLSDEGEVASRGVARLARIVHMADVRLSSLYPIFAAAFLWDVHLGRALERWRRRHGEHVADWMDALGQLETLAAFATLAADHPAWCFPEPPSDEGPALLHASGLGHPLLSPGACVPNDVEVGPPGSVLLVTGSNMSGKSTLLRSIGLAAVMAGAGMPVCAESLKMPSVRLFTSMRVHDSLEAGVSYFMAELLRLKELLARADRPSEAARPLLLYLVDEILQGTNSEERQQAGRRLIRHLLRSHAIGAVTTHDLDLHRDPEVEAGATLVHFRESLDEESDGLSFDYLLRPGLATTRNALLLAERVGLTDPEAEA